VSPTQLKFAEISGLDNTLLSALENGRQQLRDVHLAQLADAGIDISYVITGRRGGDLLGQGESALLDAFRSLDAIARGVLLLTAAKMAPQPHFTPRAVIEEMLKALPEGDGRTDAFDPETGPRSIGAVHEAMKGYRGEGE